MKNPISKLAVAVVLGTGSAGWAAIIPFTDGGGGSFTAVSPGSQAIADYPGAGVGYSLNFNAAGYSQLTDITVTFTTTGGWNGDLYAYLSHGSGLAILLNQVGASGGSPDGYSTSGFNNITLGMASVPGGDIHFVLSPTTAGGPYEADGRLTYDSGTRANTLSVFNNVDPNGDWTLYFEDASAVNQSTLSSWSVGITAVPESVSVALGMFGGAFALLQLGRNPRLRKWILEVARR